MKPRGRTPARVRIAGQWTTLDHAALAQAHERRESATRKSHVIVLDTFDDRTQSIYCKACDERITDVAGDCPGKRKGG